MRVRAYVPTELIIQQGSWTPFGAPKGCGFFFLTKLTFGWTQNSNYLFCTYGCNVMCTHEFYESLLILRFQIPSKDVLMQFAPACFVGHIICYPCCPFHLPTQYIYRFPTTNRFKRIEGVITYECTCHSIQHTSPKNSIQHACYGLDCHRSLLLGP